MERVQIDREFEKKHIGRTLECYKRIFTKKIETKVSKYLSKLRVSILLTTNRLVDKDLISFSKNLEDYLFDFEDDFDAHLTSHVQIVRNKLNVGHIDVSLGSCKHDETDQESHIEEKKEEKDGRGLEFEEDKTQIFGERMSIEPKRQCNGLFQLSSTNNLASDGMDFELVKRKKRKGKGKKSIKMSKKPKKLPANKGVFMKTSFFDYPEQADISKDRNLIRGKAQAHAFSSDEEDFSPFQKPKKLGKRNKREPLDDYLELEKPRPKKSIKLGEAVKSNTDVFDQKFNLPATKFKFSNGINLSKDSASFNPQGTFFSLTDKVNKSNTARKDKNPKNTSKLNKMDKPSVAEPSIFQKSTNLGKPSN